MGKTYEHISDSERRRIERLRESGKSLRTIAERLGRGVSTVSEELKRNKVKGMYDARKAQHKAYVRRWRSKQDCLKVVMDAPLKKYVEDRLRDEWSPELIAGRLKQQQKVLPYASTKAIYKFIHSRCLEQYLLGKKKRKSKRISYLTDSRKFIENRPELAGIGHYEMDFIVSGSNTFSLLVLVEKQSKLTFAYLISDKKKETLIQTFKNIVSRVKIETVTTDNDIAFSCWKELERRFGFQIFFCHPYRSWEKPLVEQTNKLIRQFIPKGTNLSLISERKLQEIHKFLNEKPRQCLNYLTAYEAYQSLQK